jgi:hypothetical protein
LPKSFLGSWINKRDGKAYPVEGINIDARTYHEPGYDCRINRVRKVQDAADSDARAYVIDMTCADDGAAPGPAEKVHQIWALRSVNGEDVLIMAGTSSISVLQRPR